MSEKKGALHSPSIPSIKEAEKSVIDDFQLLDEWLLRYEYLIELGRKLPEMKACFKTEENRLYGCQANVWLVAKEDKGCLYFQASSDSAIVAGLIALLLSIYSGRTAQAIFSHPPIFIEEMGLEQHLSIHRKTGLRQMLRRIYMLVQPVQKTAENQVLFHAWSRFVA